MSDMSELTWIERVVETRYRYFIRGALGTYWADVPGRGGEEVVGQQAIVTTRGIVFGAHPELGAVRYEPSATGVRVVTLVERTEEQPPVFDTP